MPEVTTEQLVLRLCERIDSKLSTNGKALLLGLGISGLSRAEITVKASIVAQALTNEEVVLLTRILLNKQCKQLDKERSEELIHSLLYEELPSSKQYENRINLIYRIAVSRSVNP